MNRHILREVILGGYFRSLFIHLHLLGQQFLDKLSQNKVDYQIKFIIEINPFNSGEFLG
jgi:hypothetical protein